LAPVAPRAGDRRQTHNIETYRQHLAEHGLVLRRPRNQPDERAVLHEPKLTTVSPLRPPPEIRVPNKDDLRCCVLCRWQVRSSPVRKGQQPPWIVADGLWQRIVPLLPKPVVRDPRRPGRSRLDHRKVLCAILFDKYRSAVPARGIKPHIARRGQAHGSGLGVFRWVVERTIAWYQRHETPAHPAGTPRRHPPGVLQPRDLHHHVPTRHPTLLGI
jgi:transposase